MDCRPLFFRIPSENIVQIKNILETYDGMTGELRTLNPEKGEIVIFAMPDTEQTVRELVLSLKAELGVREMPAPAESLDGDWLLKDYVSEGKLNSQKISKDK